VLSLGLLARNQSGIFQKMAHGYFCPSSRTPLAILLNGRFSAGLPHCPDPAIESAKNRSANWGWPEKSLNPNIRMLHCRAQWNAFPCHLNLKTLIASPAAWILIQRLGEAQEHTAFLLRITGN
jgi:hypothetical protein